MKRYYLYSAVLIVAVGVTALLVNMKSPVNLQGAADNMVKQDNVSGNIDYPIKRKIQYSFTVQNTSSQLLKGAEFWAYGPVKQTSTQLTENIEATYPYDLIADELGNQILHFKFDDVAPFATKIVTIKAEIALTDNPIATQQTDFAIFSGPEKYVESDNPGIITAAQQLADTTPAKTAEKMFAWTVGNIKYAGFIKDDLGALYALKNKKGDCTEFMYLFTALSRANGIPARGVGGYVYQENSILKPDDYHNWSEFYLDNKWQLADAQNNVFMKKQSHYIAMRIISETSSNVLGNSHRFSYTGEGLKIKMNS